MQQGQRKHKQNLLKCQHQLKQIEHSCHTVVEMSRQLNNLSQQLQQSEINTRKLQYIKSQIKDKLKQYALYIDQIYKILDRKIIIIVNQIQEIGRSKGIQLNSDRGRMESVNSSGQRVYNVEKDTQKTNQKSNATISNDKFFSDTLNPRILHLQQRIIQYQNNQIILNHKISQLKAKNQKLLQEFTVMSKASNKKINQLSSELHNVTSRDRDSFNSFDSREDLSPKGNRPFLVTQEKKSSTSLSPQKQNIISNKISQISVNDGKKQARPFTFGCMQVNKPKQQDSQVISFSKNGGDYQGIGRQDRHRRFDILLTKLRYGQKQGKPQAQTKKKQGQQEYGSVFSKDVVNRYHV